MSETTENTDKLINFVGEKFEKRQINNDTLVQLIELSAAYLNLMTISEYAKVHKMSYNGVKRFRKIIIISGVKLVVDNN